MSPCLLTKKGNYFAENEKKQKIDRRTLLPKSWVEVGGSCSYVGPVECVDFWGSPYFGNDF